MSSGAVSSEAMSSGASSRAWLLAYSDEVDGVVRALTASLDKFPATAGGLKNRSDVADGILSLSGWFSKCQSGAVKHPGKFKADWKLCATGSRSGRFTVSMIDGAEALLTLAGFARFPGSMMTGACFKSKSKTCFDAHALEAAISACEACPCKLVEATTVDEAPSPPGPVPAADSGSSPSTEGPPEPSAVVEAGLTVSGLPDSGSGIGIGIRSGSGSGSGSESLPVPPRVTPENVSVRMESARPPPVVVRADYEEELPRPSAASTGNEEELDEEGGSSYDELSPTTTLSRMMSVEIPPADDEDDMWGRPSRFIIRGCSAHPAINTVYTRMVGTAAASVTADPSSSCKANGRCVWVAENGLDLCIFLSSDGDWCVAPLSSARAGKAEQRDRLAYVRGLGEASGPRALNTGTWWESGTATGHGNDGICVQGPMLHANGDDVVAWWPEQSGGESAGGEGSWFLGRVISCPEDEHETENEQPEALGPGKHVEPPKAAPSWEILFLDGSVAWCDIVRPARWSCPAEQQQSCRVPPRDEAMMLDLASRVIGAECCDPPLNMLADPPDGSRRSLLAKAKTLSLAVGFDAASSSRTAAWRELIAFRRSTLTAKQNQQNQQNQEQSQQQNQEQLKQGDVDQGCDGWDLHHQYLEDTKQPYLTAQQAEERRRHLVSQLSPFNRNPGCGGGSAVGIRHKATGPDVQSFAATVDQIQRDLDRTDPEGAILGGSGAPQCWTGVSGRPLSSVPDGDGDAEVGGLQGFQGGGTAPPPLRAPPLLALESVLILYAIRNPSVGYCQGMNLMAAVLLRATGGDVTSAFDALAAAAETELDDTLGDPGLAGVQADARVLPWLCGRCAQEVGVAAAAPGAAPGGKQPAGGVSGRPSRLSEIASLLTEQENDYGPGSLVPFTSKCYMSGFAATNNARGSGGGGGGEDAARPLSGYPLPVLVALWDGMLSPAGRLFWYGFTLACWELRSEEILKIGDDNPAMLLMSLDTCPCAADGADGAAASGTPGGPPSIRDLISTAWRYTEAMMPPAVLEGEEGKEEDEEVGQEDRAGTGSGSGRHALHRELQSVRARHLDDVRTELAALAERRAALRRAREAGDQVAAAAAAKSLESMSAASTAIQRRARGNSARSVSAARRASLQSPHLSDRVKTSVRRGTLSPGDALRMQASIKAESRLMRKEAQEGNAAAAAAAVPELTKPHLAEEPRKAALRTSSSEKAEKEEVCEKVGEPCESDTALQQLVEPVPQGAVPDETEGDRAAAAAAAAAAVQTERVMSQKKNEDAAVQIQRAARGHSARMSSSHHREEQRLQRQQEEKAEHERARAKAALRIQSASRSKCARRDATKKREDAAAETARRIQEEAEEAELAEKHLAAVCMQRAGRGHLGRKEFARRLAARRQAERSELERSASKVIQFWSRQCKLVQEAKGVVSRLRGAREERRAAAQHAAAVAIQRCARGRAARQYCDALAEGRRVEHRERACGHIQRVCLGFLGRLRYRVVRELADREAAEQRQAAGELQRTWRGKQGREAASTARVVLAHRTQAAVKIQCVARGGADRLGVVSPMHAAREAARAAEAVRREGAAVYIQSAQRGCAARRRTVVLRSETFAVEAAMSERLLISRGLLQLQGVELGVQSRLAETAGKHKRQQDQFHQQQQELLRRQRRHLLQPAAQEVQQLTSSKPLTPQPHAVSSMTVGIQQTVAAVLASYEAHSGHRAARLGGLNAVMTDPGLYKAAAEEAILTDKILAATGEAGLGRSRRYGGFGLASGGGGGSVPPGAGLDQVHVVKTRALRQSRLQRGVKRRTAALVDSVESLTRTVTLLKAQGYVT